MAQVLEPGVRSTSERPSLGSLQAARAVAALWVVLFHATSLSHERLGAHLFRGVFTFGFVGVDFFFVLSGFIIYYVNAGRDHGDHFSTYLTKRLLRVFPIYWIVSGVKVALLLLVPSAAKPHELQPGFLIASFLLAPQPVLPIIGAAWTLSYELLFYLVFGVAVAVKGRTLPIVLVAWMTLVAAGQVLLAMRVVDARWLYLLEFLANERNAEFVLGAAAAYLVTSRRIGVWPAVASLLSGLALFALSSAELVGGHDIAWYSIRFGLPSMLIVVGLSGLELRNGLRVPSSLQFLGDASYAIYLTHAFFLGLLFKVLEAFAGRLNWRGAQSAAVVAAICSAIAAGCVVHLLVERPVLATLRARLLRREHRGPSSTTQRLSLRGQDVGGLS